MASLVQSIQRGSVTIAGSGAETDVTISAVDMSRSLVICTHRCTTSNADEYMVYYELTSTTNIQLRLSDMLISGAVIEWQVIEFTSASGITVQRGISTTTGTNNITITAVSAQNQACVFVSQWSSIVNLNTANATQAKVTSTTNLQIITNGNTNPRVWQVVDWGVHATVQNVDISVLTTDTGTKDITISALTDYTKTVVVGYTGWAAVSHCSDIATITCTSNTNLQYIRNGSIKAHTCTAQIIEFKASNIAVQRLTASIGVDNTSATATLSPAVTTANTLIIPGSSYFGFGGSTTSNDTAAEFAVSYTLTDTTTVTLTRNATTNTTYTAFSVMDFSDTASGSLSATLNINLNNLDISSSTSVSGTALVTSVSSDKPDGTYTTGEEIYISVEFSRPVSVSGTPQLDLAVKSGGYKVNYVAMKSPLDVVSLAGWYDASDTSTITQSGGLVSQWNDKSGNSRHLIQSNDTLKPLSNSVSIGNLNALDFHSVTADKISTSAAYTFLNATAYSILAVLKYDSAGGYFIGIGQPSNYTGLHTGYRNTTQYTLDHYNAGIDITVTPNTSTPMILNPQFNNLGSNIRINGASIGSSGGFPAVALATTTGVLNIGNGHDTSNPFNGMIGEVLIYTGALSDANREQLEGILAHKWGLTSYLSGSHPYKNRPPLVS